MNTRLIFVLLAVFFIFGIVFLGFRLFYLKKINNYQLVPVRITIPEGFTREGIALKLKPFKNFNKENFFGIAKEGYLFPDTYFLSGRENENDIVRIMGKNFENKVGEIKSEVLVMASLLEKESRLTEERKIISGILWKRLKAGMPLQVDCAPDTYICGGLPSAPICNPGLDSIGAALNPVESEYWYYLHDKKGIIHYAKKFEEHKINEAKYLTK
ncbi:MAG: endolytic transglycosylase MltG [Candidatus Parcubacteria bacterium]|nr:endolytic transglycosylase MltG [Candidatus Parcubacteria bacterium]